jgi:hypothetical protein
VGPGRKVVAALLALGLAGVVQARAPQMQVQYAEPVAIPTGTGTVSFDAYGRRFIAELADNPRVTAKEPAQRKVDSARYHILKGKLADEPRSWVRLAETGGRVEGAIWDGQDLYVVTSLAGIAGSLTTPIAGAPEQTVVYRLSDTIDAFPRAMCPVLPASDGVDPNNGLTQYRGVVAELALRKLEAAVTMPRQIEISLIGDPTFQAKYADPTFELLARHNVVDGVYAEQVGLLILPTDLRIITATPDPFTSTNGSTLLGQVSGFRTQDATSRARGITHLVTGRILDGDTVGIARLGGVCSAADAVSLTESSSGPTRDGLIMSHELGHNFGAVHDGTGACASTGDNFIMSPALNFSETFSQCSLDTMRPVIAAAQCMTAANYGDVELPAPAPEIGAELDNNFVVAYSIRSTGTQMARNAGITIVAPPGISVASTSMPSACVIAGPTVTCHLGDIPAGENRNVSVTFHAGELGIKFIEARASADNNPSTHNDFQQQRVQITANADAAISMTASATTVLVGDIVDFTVVVSSIRSRELHNAVMKFRPFTFGTPLRMDTATVPGGSCTFAGGEASCALGDIESGGSRTITIRTTAVAVSVGPAQNSAVVEANVDANSANNEAYVSVTVNPTQDVGFAEVTPNSFSLYGEPFEFRANLKSFGAQPINNVAVQLTLQFPLATSGGIDSVTIGGVACAPQAPNFYQCAVGMLAAAETRPVVIQGHGAGIGTYGFSLRLTAPTDQFSANNELTRGITVKHGVDVQLFSPPGSNSLEGQEFYNGVNLQSNGIQGVTDALLEISVPTAVRFTRVSTNSGYGSCSLVDTQHIQCTMHFEPNGLSGTTSITWFAIGDAPGTYTLTARVTTPNDAVASNNAATASINIVPIVDVGMRPLVGPEFVMVGSEFSVPATVFAGSKPVSAVKVLVEASTGTEIRSVTSTVGTCLRINAAQFQCDIGGLAGGASVSFSGVFAAVSAFPASGIRYLAQSLEDNGPANNEARLSLATMDPGDMSVTVNPHTVVATAGVDFDLPPIQVGRVGYFVNGRLDITVPAGVTITQIYAPAQLCSGTTVIKCILTEWPAGQQFTFNLKLQASSAGNYNVGVKVVAANETNPADNEATIAVTVSASTPPPITSPPTQNPPGGGGGGRLEWLALAVLGLLATRRIQWFRWGRTVPALCRAKNTGSSSLFLRQSNLTYILSAFLQVKLPTWPASDRRAGNAECERRGVEFAWEYWLWPRWSRSLPRKFASPSPSNWPFPAKAPNSTPTAAASR